MAKASRSAILKTVVSDLLVSVTSDNKETRNGGDDAPTSTTEISPWTRFNLM